MLWMPSCGVNQRNANDDLHINVIFMVKLRTVLWKMNFTQTMSKVQMRRRKRTMNHPWEPCLAVMGTNIVHAPGYKSTPGSCDLAQWLWRYVYLQIATPL
jgi:hypothetical protein